MLNELTRRTRACVCACHCVCVCGGGGGGGVGAIKQGGAPLSGEGGGGICPKCPPYGDATVHGKCMMKSNLLPMQEACLLCVCT